MPIIRIDPTDLSEEVKRDLLAVVGRTVYEVHRITGIQSEMNGVQITLDGRDQPPTIDVRYVCPASKM